jgi:hypothetical protein
MVLNQIQLSLKMKSCLKAIDFSLNMPMFPDNGGPYGSTDGTNNTINHLTIKNATIGLLIQNNDGTTVSIKNTQIYNSSNYGILAQTAKSMVKML